ncbi:phosphatase PAP2 family protein [Alteribacter keqinensis]|uniref:Phosphatase PAP2 family protein n=1 Tax=Alteribacter keqinensis TaxID=2483800 RepID=A0A3M7TXV0_9BACI|nr:phosphatase PAP2 family protein [Alteribacter keqinensis]RNA70428.1 phosphatase PAP2 family protein [Alteribacter keqinensis]
MVKSLEWIFLTDRMLFKAINRCKETTPYHMSMGLLTHLGGAVMTVTIALLLLIVSSPAWKGAAIQSALALIISHLIVTALKKGFKRARPYLVVGNSYVIRNPLQDSSFPSGHTTAIFSLVTPYMFYFPGLILILLPLALIVAISRISIGLHYPSDVIAGAALGVGTAFVFYQLWMVFWI